jgi:hypothetical protein
VFLKINKIISPENKNKFQEIIKKTARNQGPKENKLKQNEAQIFRK